MAGVVLNDVVKVYEGGVKVVDRFNLEIADREFVVLVGPSGCGKSTTLRMIAGLEEITSGTISIGGNVVNDVPPKDRDIAMVFQSYALYPHMTVYENMAFALKLRKTPKATIDEKVKRAAKILGIEALLERKPKALSGGQRQRVAVGRAIVRDPKCFLFDEPLSNLDAKLRVEMRAEIKPNSHEFERHDHLRDPRPGRGDDARRSRGRDEGRHHPAVRRRARNLPPPRQSLRRRLPRQPADELLLRQARERGRQALLRRGQREAPRPGLGEKRARSAAPGKSSCSASDRRRMADMAHARFATRDRTLSMRVTLVQPLGDRMDVYLATDHHPHSVAQVQAYPGVKPGDTLTIAVDPERMHFFEPGELGQATSRTIPRLPRGGLAS